MWGRRIGYLVSLLGCLVLYLYFTQWAAWVLMWWLLALPLFSLLLSLPAMLTAECAVKCPDRVQQGADVKAGLEILCRFPVPPVRYRLQVRHCITGDVSKTLDTTHCGTRQLRVEQLRIYDYLGLFSHRIKTIPTGLLIVEPQPLETEALCGQAHSDRALIPKRGGGFSEEHELREYLPGDDLRQIHWKLSAKTGKTVVRQPMEQQTHSYILMVLLRGDPQELDRILGRLLWLSNTLVQQGQKHCVRVLSGRGLEQFQVSDGESCKTMMDSILSAPQAPQNAVLPETDEQAYIVEGGYG